MFKSISYILKIDFTYKIFKPTNLDIFENLFYGSNIVNQITNLTTNIFSINKMLFHFLA